MFTVFEEYYKVPLTKSFNIKVKHQQVMESIDLLLEAVRKNKCC